MRGEGGTETTTETKDGEEYQTCEEYLVYKMKIFVKSKVDYDRL